MHDRDPVRPLRRIGNAVAAFRIRRRDEFAFAREDDPGTGDAFAVGRDAPLFHRSGSEQDCSALVVALDCD